MTTGAADIGTDARDTFPKLLAERARTAPDRPAYREKEYGIWQTYGWGHVASEVGRLAAGLADLGFRRGDRLIVIGDNRPRLYWSMCAAQSLGGVPVPVYQDSVTDELAYVVEHAGARFALAENQEQVDKLLEIQRKVPSLGVVIYDDPRGLRHYESLLSYAAVQERGAELLAATQESDLFRGLIFVLTFFTIGLGANFKKLWAEGIGRLALVYLLSLFGFIIWIGLAISWLFFHGVPAAGGK